MTDGIRVPVAISGATLIGGIIWGALVYGDVENLKKAQVPEARIVKLEAKVDALTDEVKELKAAQAEAKKESSRDTERILEEIRKSQK